MQSDRQSILPVAAFCLNNPSRSAWIGRVGFADCAVMLFDGLPRTSALTNNRASSIILSRELFQQGIGTIMDLRTALLRFTSGTPGSASPTDVRASLPAVPEKRFKVVPERMKLISGCRGRRPRRPAKQRNSELCSVNHPRCVILRNEATKDPERSDEGSCFQIKKGVENFPTPSFYERFHSCRSASIGFSRAAR